MSLRRFISVLKLNDEEEYDRLVETLTKKEQSITQIVAEVTKSIFYDI